MNPMVFSLPNVEVTPPSPTVGSSTNQHLTNSPRGFLTQNTNICSSGADLFLKRIHSTTAEVFWIPARAHFGLWLPSARGKKKLFLPPRSGPNAFCSNQPLVGLLPPISCGPASSKAQKACSLLLLLGLCTNLA